MTGVKVIYLSSAESGLEKIKNETVKKMRKMCTNGGDSRGGLETRRLLTKKYVYNLS